MVDSTKTEKPCLIKTEQGFSIQYQSKFLYSKYNPGKNILQIINNLQIIPGTVFLCFSPVLNYGIKELVQKLPENCHIFAIEADLNLFDFIKQNNIDEDYPDNKIFTLVSPKELYSLPEKISQMNHGNYRRCVRIDFSSGVQFHANLYSELYNACQNSVGQFWKNRMTLVKFGRRYCANIFRNLKILEKSASFLTTEKPVIVVGAGESSLNTLHSIKNTKNRYFIIAVDAILHTMKSLDIRPDAVICEEAQDIIAKAFTGCSDFYDHLFVSASTNPNVTKLTPEKNIFYTTKFCDTPFLEKLIDENILCNPIPPLGSVGLSAMEIALKIRSSIDVPVYVTGMDFSYSIGQTHAIGSFHEKNRRTINNKLIPVESFSSSFNNDSRIIKGKDGNIAFTTTNLSNYANLFTFKYSDVPNVFDIGTSGIDLKLKTKKCSELTAQDSGKENRIILNKTDNLKIKQFLAEEKKALLSLLDIFTGKTNISDVSRNEKIKQLIEKREYLYLHFPDGYQFTLSQDFLNRIRIQIDYFLKILK